MKCEECQFNYPPELLHPVQVSGSTRGNICGICALEISNRAHGIKRKSFTGPMAEAMRLAAIEWRKNFPPKR